MNSPRESTLAKCSLVRVHGARDSLGHSIDALQCLDPVLEQADNL